MLRSETPGKSSRLHQSLEKLPWWTYAAATVIVTMVIASMNLSQRASMPVKGPSVSLPVKPLDAGELRPAKNEAPAIAAPQGARPAEKSPTMPIFNPSEMPEEKKPAKRIESSRVKSTPIPSGPGHNYLCAEVLARAQLGEPLSDADRDALKKECK